MMRLPVHVASCAAVPPARISTGGYPSKFVQAIPSQHCMRRAEPACTSLLSSEVPTTVLLSALPVVLGSTVLCRAASSPPAPALERSYARCAPAQRLACTICPSCHRQMESAQSLGVAFEGRPQLQPVQRAVCRLQDYIAAIVSEVHGHFATVHAPAAMHTDGYRGVRAAR